VLRVVLVDDHALIREGLRRAVSRSTDMSVVGEAASIKEALAVINHVKPDVCVIDIRLPDGDGTTLCEQLRTDDPTCAVVMLTMYGDRMHVQRARLAGASAFVSKDAPASEVVKAIRRASERPDQFSTAEAVISADGQDDGVVSMTPREQEVLGLLADGLGVAGISAQLHISESTTKTHVTNIYAKLGASNRAQALMTALREGLIDQPRA
jgi:DNA-binding NarL/FixJ family response regulator